MKIPIPTERVWLHDLVIPIRWGDMDAYGHVNNAMYFRYMETARVAWLEATGFVLDPQRETPLIVNAFCNFWRELSYPGDLLLKTYVGQVGRTSLDLFHDMLRTDTGERVYASGGATVVWMDMQQRRATPLPLALRQHLGA